MEVFRLAVNAVVHAKSLSGTNERTEQKEIDGRAILSSSDELLSPAAQRIVLTIGECLARMSRAHGLSSKRDEAFQAFHRAIFTAVAELRRKLYGTIGIEYTDQLLSQSVNQVALYIKGSENMYFCKTEDEIFQCYVIGTQAFVRCYSGTPILFRRPLVPKRERIEESALWTIIRSGIQKLDVA